MPSDVSSAGTNFLGDGLNGSEPDDYGFHDRLRRTRLRHHSVWVRTHPGGVMTGDTLIPIQIWEETSALPDADPVTQTGARCSKCGYEVLVEGRGEAAALKCVEALRTDCPFAEENEYVPDRRSWQ